LSIKQTRLNQYLVLFLLLSGAVYTADAATKETKIMGWVASDSETYSFGRENNYFSPDGVSYAYIDGARWSEEWSKIYTRRKSTGYLSQTIRAKEHLGKHLHISGFVKTESVDIDFALKRYQKILEAQIIEEYGGDERLTSEIMQQYVSRQVELAEKSLKYHSQNIEYGISVFLHTPNKIFRQDMTQSIMKEGSDWWRLNVEVGIPSNCEYVSVVVWSGGFVKTAVDYLAVVEQGEILERDKMFDSYSSESNGALISQLRNHEDQAKYQFENLSFEQN